MRVQGTIQLFGELSYSIAYVGTNYAPVIIFRISLNEIVSN
jgi:hypothetical protein